MVLKTNTSKILTNEDVGNSGETFDLVYRGHSEVDRHYTKPMLPWIIAEIKNQHRTQQVTVRIQNGVFTAKIKESKECIVSHTISQIHKCVIEQADHRCFLYTLRPPDQLECKPKTAVRSEDCTPQPCNISATQNYHCHLYQALTEQEVRNFFSCLHHQPREVKIKGSDSISNLHSLPDLSVHVESQFFEVLFVGRVKVSDCKVPATFIDEALRAFKSREKKRQRNTSGESHQPSSPNRIMSFQQEGSAYSVPNIILHSPGHAELRELMGAAKAAKEGELMIEREKVRFQLGGSFDNPSIDSASLPSLGDGSNRSKFLLPSDRLENKENSYNPKRSSRQTTPDVSDEKLTIFDVKPNQHARQRYFSGERSLKEPELQDTIHRMRTSSMSGSFSRQQSLRSTEEDVQRLRYDFNRTMLFHVGYREIQLINPEQKSVQLNKSFKEIAGCCQGLKNGEHFGFICRELSGEVIVYVGYIFRCQKSSVADEIMQVMNSSFSAMHEKDRQEHLMCDFCPLKWLSLLCAEVEGLAAAKAHNNIMKRVSQLPEEERELIIAKYEGVETHDVPQKNNVLIMLLRTHFEYKQLKHQHPTECTAKGDFNISSNLETSLKRAKKTLTTSFSQLLKREPDTVTAEKESSPVPEMPIRTRASNSPEASSPKEYVLEGISDSPLKPHRTRSSTVTAAGGEAMRKELLGRKAVKKSVPEPESEIPIETPTTTPSRSPTQQVTENYLPFMPSSEPDDIDNRSMTSFRHAMLQKVVSPNRKDSPSRKTSRGKSPSDKQFDDVPKRRSGRQLIILWKKLIFQQMILSKFEKETKRLEVLHKEATLQRVRLNYEDDSLPGEAMQAWELILSRPGTAIDPTVLTLGIKQGIPKLIRGEIWLILMSQQSRTLTRQLQDRPALYNASYEMVLKELTSQQHAILIDLGRTFPSHPYFTQTLGPGQLALFNILKAYSIVDKEVGYCQGLCFLGGVLLMHVEEVEAYQLLKHIMYEKGCRHQYRNDLDNLQIQMYQLSRLVRDKFLDLHYHLEDFEVTPHLYAAPWFLTLFASQFPLNFVARVFDLVLLFGMEAVFAVCMVLLKFHEQEILALDSFEQIVHYLKSNLPLITTDQLNEFFAEVCDCNLAKELAEYEVEYRVLQEEQFVSPQQITDIRKMAESNKNLKRQNLDLLDQLNKVNRQKQFLENNNQSLQQNHHHLEVRVRWLEVERGNMRQLIDLLSGAASKEDVSKIPQNLQRYLPHRVSSPSGPRERHVTFGSTEEHLGPPSILQTGESAPFKRGRGNIDSSAPRQASWSPVRSKKVIPDGGQFLSLLKADIKRDRSNTLDPKGMIDYFKTLKHTT